MTTGFDIKTTICQFVDQGIYVLGYTVRYLDIATRYCPGDQKCSSLNTIRDDAVIGAMFYIMEFVDGDVFWDAALPEKNPQQRGAMYEAMSSLLADLHSIDVAPMYE